MGIRLFIFSKLARFEGALVGLRFLCLNLRIVDQKQADLVNGDREEQKSIIDCFLVSQKLFLAKSSVSTRIG